MEGGFCSKLRKVTIQIYTALKSLTGLIIILALYNIIGAIIFVRLEAQHEQDQASQSDNRQHELIGLLSNLSAMLKGPDVVDLKKRTLTEIERLNNTIEGKERIWDFWKAMFFCGTIHTTIGYGNIYPKTDGGKIAAIFYAAFGIPLAMKVLAVLGKKLSIILKFIYVRLRRCCCCKIKERQKYKVTDKEKDATLELQEKGVIKIEQENPEDHVEQEVEERLPIALPVVILVIYILLGGLMYTFWEDWGYLDAFYFVFVSISTIGFGDITPAHTKYFMVTSLYVFVGLALVSMCINVIIDFYILSLKLAVHQMDVVKHKVADGCSCGSKRQKGIDQNL